MEIIINHKYKLVPLIKVRKDDIGALLSDRTGVYICNYPDENWYKKHKLIQNTNYSIEKKTKFLETMGENSQILSPTEDSKIRIPTLSFRNQNVIHFGSRFTGRLGQIIKAIKIIFWLTSNRSAFEYCLCYNFYPAEILASTYAKYILKKELIIDFEDDYLLQSKNKFYNIYFYFVKYLPDRVICINENMQKYFLNNKTIVFNGFINESNLEILNYELDEGFNLLYSGALDDIRGVDLIPELIIVLRKKYQNFIITITGSGFLEDFVKSWNFPEVRFLGFLSTEEYIKILKESSGFLVLQKPDHPFYLGSFPSKIEFFSKYKKPIYKVELT